MERKVVEAVSTEIDRLFDEQFLITDFDKRKDAFWKLGKRISDVQAWIPVYIILQPWVANNRVTGFDPDFRGVTFDAANWGIKN